MSQASRPTDEEPPRLRALRRLVTLLTATMILGILTVAATLVIRIASEPTAPAPLAAAPETVSLPPGETIVAVGATREALAVATRDEAGAERLRLFHPETGAPIGETTIRRD